MAGVLQNGLFPGGLAGSDVRKHVMISPEVLGSRQQTSGMRKDSAVILTLDREALAAAVEKGLMSQFYQTEQWAVIQQDIILPHYIIDARESKSGYILYARDCFAAGGMMRGNSAKCNYPNPLGATLCLRCWDVISEGEQAGPTEATREENLAELGLTGWRLGLFRETGLVSGQQSRRKGASAFELASTEIKKRRKTSEETRLCKLVGPA